MNEKSADERFFLLALLKFSVDILAPLIEVEGG